MREAGGPLVDQIFAATYHPERQIDNPNPEGDKGGRRLALQIRTALTSARRYFLDDDTVRAATTLGVQHPDILLAMLPRARLPFPKTWIEWRQGAALEEQGLDTPEGSSPRLNGAYIEQISAPGEFPVFRITEMGMTTFRITDTGMTSDDNPLVSAHATSIVFSLDQPILERMPDLNEGRSSLARLSDVSKENMDRCLLGSTYREVDTDLSKYLGLFDDQPEGHSAIHERKAMANHRLDLCRNLASFATHAWSPFFVDYHTINRVPLAQHTIYANVVKHSILEFSGTWRFIVTVLALIQARTYTSEETPVRRERRRFVGNKVVPYLQYWKVSLKLPRQVVIRSMIDSVRESLPRPQPRREIEGYWRETHRHADPDCDHVDVSETADRYRCVHCKRARWFTAAYMRGSSEVGFVKKDRVVELRSKHSD